MKKSIFLFAILLIGALSISAAIEKQILGKWYVHSMSMEGNTETFDSAETAPWMEFQEDNVLLLGEPGRDTDESSWSFNKETNGVTLDFLGEEAEFSIESLTDNTFVLKIGVEDNVAILTLKRQL